MPNLKIILPGIFFSFLGLHAIQATMLGRRDKNFNFSLFGTMEKKEKEIHMATSKVLSGLPTSHKTWVLIGFICNSVTDLVVCQPGIPVKYVQYY